ncbi:hypothetical protein J3Q64DRAFT_1708226 [Phycomyces blakesleeanus]|uniref:Secreted protein n=1 Tax=Phycomyces blakesleeanus TaxID=4837 RepID=A0ABR3BCG5_PHYBL
MILDISTIWWIILSLLRISGSSPLSLSLIALALELEFSFALSASSASSKVFLFSDFRVLSAGLTAAGRTKGTWYSCKS